MTRPEYALLAELRPVAATHVETHIPIIDEAEATGETAAAYQHFRDRMGRQDVPGILKCFSTNPAFVRYMVDVSSTLLFADGSLTRRQKEMIATYTSKLNACPYCLDSHGFYLLVHGAPEEMAQKIIAGDIDNAGLSDAERQLLLYVGKVNGESFRITKEDAQQLRELGWNDEQIAEAVHVAVMMGLCNRVANAFGLPSQGFLDLKR
jgi:uncharacterized peroxidase-related enzyme